MTRPALSINTTTATHDTTIYSISQSPIIESKQSIESIRTVTVVGNDADTSKADLKSSQSTKPTQTPPTPRNLKPSVRLLFSQLSRKDTYLYLCPAIAVAMISGGIAPFMTVVLGESFDAFARFSTGSVSQAQKDALVRDVGINCIELAALAVGSFILGTSMSALWITTGERNVMMLRKRVYESVVRRNIEWFDTKIGSEDGADGDTTVGVGGMMASFAKDTEEVRMASSLASGTIVQSLTSCIVCLVLAFSRSWSLTLLILAGVPVIVFTQTIAQRKAGAGLVFERKYNESAATLVDRAVSSIATVKAFNAEPDEVSSFSDLMDTSMDWGRRITGVWGISSGLVQFVSMTMFVQAFWFGAELVRSGSLSPGTVTAVFWACLIATTSLQKCLVPLVQLTKGKWAMIPLLSLIDPPAAPITPTPETKAHPHMVLTPITPAKSNLVHSPHFANKSLRGIRPSKCLGELALYDVEFAYPSRPDILILKGASLFLPANDTTFIVGGSGSGKSTIAQLLAQMYYPQDGCISLDDQDIAYLDEDWTRQHVALVSQSCILFDMTVHENVAMGIAGSDKDRRPEDVSREEVIQVCTMALMHEFIRDLPNGYDTKLGTGGSSLSGGQKQRLAIARALLRDPTVLILDEATSALDVISRVLVFEAIRACRKGKTTIVITHDLSQIQSTDFVYVLKHGEVFEQGYRSDLELDTHGEFYEMSKTQKAIGGLPEKQTEPTQEEKIMHESERDALLEQIDVEREDESVARQNKHRSLGSALIPADGLDSLFEAFKDFSGSVEEKRSTISASIVRRSSSRSSKTGNKILSSTFPRRASLQQQRSSLDYPSLKSLPSKQSRKSRRSLQFTPLSPVYSVRPSSVHSIEDDEEIILEKLVMDQTGLEASRKRHGARLVERRTKWEDVCLDDVKVEKANVTDNNKSTPSLIRLAYQIFPTINNKPRFFISLLICIASGAMTPVFSYVLSRLTFEVSIGAQNVSTLNILGGLALAFTALDGLFLGLKYFLMELVGCRWLGNLRKKMYRVILAQDKKWFDKSENGPIELVQKFMKDGYEAQNILSMVLSQFLAVTAMMFTGLIWALIQSWQITLVGIGIAPIFAAAMSLQSNLVGRVEGENKIAREEVAKVYYNSIANIRAIRSMNFGSVFQQQFDSSVSRAHKSGLKGALFEGFTYGLASGLIYLAQAILFIVGAVLVARGTTSFQSMLAALNLIVFSISIGSQMMVFTRRISVSANACHDLFTLMDSSKSTDTDESRGSLKPALSGSIRLQDVYFSYPERPDVPVLQGASLRLSSNECVAVVGSSGSGKSTIALLLQRLYNPDSGSILLDETPLGAIDVHHLRQQISVVSQNPHLFDASISKNIAYGSKLSQAEIEEAAKKANVHDFIASLPNGYDTKVGENATLISGGQAQRLQIARALARNCRVLILDECTSALDPANEAAVMDTIRSASNGRTTLMITHKLHTMQMCDRICLVHQGVIAEEGTYDALLKRNGIFAQLARGGEWTSSA